MRAHRLLEHQPARKHLSKKPAEAAPAVERTFGKLASNAILQRAMIAPESLRPAEVVHMQRTLGNRAVGAMLARPLVQAKLTVNVRGDQYEQEADRVADQVMRMPAVRREELEKNETPEIMTQRELGRTCSGPFEAGEEFEQQLRASQGSGQGLPPDLRAEFEARFGADFSSVRIHADNESAAMNRAIQARAFTHRQDVYLGAGQHDLHSAEGARLLAHELTHVLQQDGGARKRRSDQPEMTITAADGNKAIQRDDDDDDYFWEQLRKQRLFMRGGEELEQYRYGVELLETAGTRATAEARSMAPKPLPSWRTRHLEMTLESRLADPLRLQPAGARARAAQDERAIQNALRTALAQQRGRARGLSSAGVERESSEHVPILEQASVREALLKGLAKQRGQVRSMAAEDVSAEQVGQVHIEKDFLLGAGASATAEARTMTSKPLSDWKKRKLALMVGQQHEIGPLEKPEELFKRRLKARETRQKEEAASGHRAKAAATESERQQRVWEYQVKASLIHAKAAVLRNRIEAAHEEIKTASKDIIVRVEEALARLSPRAVSDEATAAATTQESLNDALAKVRLMETAVDKAENDFSTTERNVVRKKQDKATERMDILQNRGLLTMIHYNAPELRAAHSAVGNAILAARWFDLAPLIDSLEKAHKEIHPTHQKLADLESRIQGLPALLAASPELVPIRTELAGKNSVSVDSLGTLANRLDTDLWSKVLQPQAEARWNALPKEINDYNNAQCAASLQTMLVQGIIKRGQFNKKYKTSYDTGGNYSVEYTIRGLPKIVIHSHCEASGRPKTGDNASHWKTKKAKFSPGTSHAIPPALAAQFIDFEEARREKVTKE